MTASWLVQSFIAVALLTPAWLAMPYFSTKFGVSGGVFGVWYFIGTAASIALFSVPAGKLVPSVPIVASLLLLGFTIGGMANNALFSAVVLAPNPGLPIAIGNLTSLTTMLAAIALASIAPAHFQSASIGAQSIIGVVLIIAGATLIAIK